MNFGSVQEDGVETKRDAEWSLAEVGRTRSGAIANMVLRAMRHVEWLGEDLLEKILDGQADPEKPHLIRDEETGIYIWFCIVREDREPPALPSDRC